MKLAPIAYLRPRSESELLAALSQHGAEAAILAGGQSLMPELALRMRSPRVVIDINHLCAAGGIERPAEQPGELRIGALVRHRDLLRDESVKAHAPLLAMAAARVGNPAVRNRGTVCGALIHADPSGEFPLAMVALDAKLLLRSSSGDRCLPAGEFFTGAHATARQPDEFLSAAYVPTADAHTFHFFDEVARRPTASAVASVAMVATCNPDETITARIAFGGVSDRPRLLAATAASVSRRPFDADAAHAVLRADISPFLSGDDAAYRLHLANTLLERARAAFCRHLNEVRPS